jgi:hypothetical protein
MSSPPIYSQHRVDERNRAREELQSVCSGAKVAFTTDKSHWTQYNTCKQQKITIQGRNHILAYICPKNTDSCASNLKAYGPMHYGPTSSGGLLLQTLSSKSKHDMSDASPKIRDLFTRAGFQFQTQQCRIFGPKNKEEFDCGNVKYASSGERDLLKAGFRTQQRIAITSRKF